MGEAAAAARWARTHDGSRGGLTLITLCLAQFVTVLSFQGAAISLPEIQRALGLSPTTAQWLVSANALAFGGLLLVGGRAADLFGHRRLFAAGLALFAAASLAVGLAPAAGWLIAARAAQGAGTALFAPAALALLAGSFPEGPARHRALAAWGAAGPLGGVAAVLLGGALVGALGWRSVFVLAMPLALLPLAIAPIVFPDDARLAAGRLDLRDTIAGTGGIALLVYGLGEASRAGVTVIALAGAGLGLVLLAAFVAGERRADAPLVPPALMGRRGMSRAVAVAVLHGAATNTPIVFYVLFLQQVQGESPLETGLGFIPCNLAVIAGSAVAARLVDRRGFTAAMAAGMAVVVAGLLTLTTIAVDGTYARTLLPGLALWGFGLGLAQVGIIGAAAAAAEPADRGIAAGLVTTSAQLGTAVGLGVLVAVAGRFGGADPEQLVAGYRAAFAGGAGLALLGLLTALLGTWRQTSSDRDPPTAA